MEMCWEDWIYDYEVLEPELRRSDWICNIVPHVPRRRC